METKLLVLMITVVEKKLEKAIADYYVSENLIFNYIIPAKGTANSKVLNYLSLGETEKVVILSVLTYAHSKEIFNHLRKEFHIDASGNGIAFIVSIDHIGSMRLNKYIKDTAYEGEEVMPEIEYEYNMIVAISNKGYANEVMEEAKNAGAKGGTIIHGRGTGRKEAEKFFGINIHPEKELILIVSGREGTAPILEAISSKSGILTNSNTIAFSLPVDSAIGLSM